MIVQGIPLIGRNLLFEQNQKHSNGHQKLLQIPDLIGDNIVTLVA